MNNRFQIIHLGNPYDFVVKDHKTNRTYGTFQGDDKSMLEMLTNFYEENEQLKQQINKLEAQLYCPYDSICINCNNEYLVQKGEYYVSRCKKGHEQCSKVDVKYCDDFELKGDDVE